jgi:hypothetical protein
MGKGYSIVLLLFLDIEDKRAEIICLDPRLDYILAGSVTCAILVALLS